MTALVGTHGYVNPLYAESSTYRRAGQFACPSRLKVAGNITLNCQCGGVEVGPIPSNVNLKKERPVCISFTLEGHGDHNVKRVMRRRRGWVRTTRVTSLSINCGVVLLLVVVLKYYTTDTTIYAARAASPKSPNPSPATSTCRKKGQFCMSFRRSRRSLRKTVNAVV
ncbi:uncharacterized protein LOC124352545 isoform X1 [Daphnia pulicaria]|uniref:uncharacterized protein LOC124352545 isoform X1 n=1 Tax=Daphnia pulicaria TaxID=35523 RepID=UPI001EEA9BF6|nr:uncharacterized protein LOC124352545 isoform X1 [Daphnia pulicaria]